MKKPFVKAFPEGLEAMSWGIEVRGQRLEVKEQQTEVGRQYVCMNEGWDKSNRLQKLLRIESQLKRPGYRREDSVSNIFHQPPFPINFVRSTKFHKNI